MLMVSQEMYERLRKEHYAKNYMSLFSDPFWDLDIKVSKSLPSRKRTGNIIQKDRFAEYDAADMDWAEPLGLAAWEEEVVHAYEVSDFLMRSRFDFAPTFRPHSALLMTCT